MTATHSSTVTGNSAIELIAEERIRHARLGRDAAHDATHTNSELTAAALCYAAASDASMLDPTGDLILETWPWPAEGFDPSDDTIRNLVIAGSLIAAEIDRRLAVLADAEAPS